MGNVYTGLDRIVSEDARELKGLRIGLLAHPASVDRRLVHAAKILASNRGWKLRAIFAPQHGWFGEAQDNMIEGVTPARVYSLYGNIREPTAEMLSHIDAMVVDLQDVGTRVYTFVQTLYLVMRSCAKHGKGVIVLDRPNPIGSATEGPTLDLAYASFVGLTPLPMRHGMTIGELARWYRSASETRAEPAPGARPTPEAEALTRQGGRENQMETLDVTIIPMRGWRRAMYFEDTGLPWVAPSPNMPTVDTAVVYPGTVLLEGTSVSEGRGTTKPFEIFGAPKISAEKLARELAGYRLPGAGFRPVYFQPTFNKHAGKLCGGVQIHVTMRRAYRAVLTGAAVLKALRRLDPKFRWKKPPYEYERQKYPIDILAGSSRLRRWIDEDRPISAYREWFEEDAANFLAKRRAGGCAR